LKGNAHQSNHRYILLNSYLKNLKQQLMSC
jgi:hypothetical protein